MPFCETCDKWRAPNALLADGTCPRCGSQMEVSELQMAATEQVDAKIPWHFWLMIAAAGIYLSWRAIQGLMLLF